MATLDFIEDPQTGKLSWKLPREKMPLTRQHVLNGMRDAGFGDLFVDAAMIDEALRHVGESEEGETQAFFVGERRHGEAQVEFDDAKMTATLHVTGAWGGKPANLKVCATVLKAAHIAQGLDVHALNEIAEQALHLAPGQTASKIVARGTPAVNGDDAKFESIAPTVKDRILTPNIREDGSVDYHELGAIPMVRTGDPLVRRIPPTPGKNGVTVTGEPCLARPGKNLPFTLLPGAQVSPQDPNLLIAAMDGMPVLIDCGMSVEKLYQVRSVNAATGNVTFEGAVVVDGDVAAGFAVNADSDINIGGLVDSAQIVAGNDVIVKNGISGSMTAKTLTPSAHITAGNTIWAPFSQFAELDAKVGIIAMNLMLHCKVNSADWVKLGGDKAGRSKLIGGEVQAVNLIKVDTLGDPSEIKTVVRLLGDFAEYHDKHKALVHRIAEREHQLSEMEALRDRMRIKPAGTQQHDEILHRIDATEHTARHDLDLAQKELTELEAAHEASCHRVRLIITRKAYPGVEIHIGDRRITLKEEWGPGTIQYGDAEGLLMNRGDVHLPGPHKKA